MGPKQAARPPSAPVVCRVSLKIGMARGVEVTLRRGSTSTQSKAKQQHSRTA